MSHHITEETWVKSEEFARDNLRTEKAMYGARRARHYVQAAVKIIDVGGDLANFYDRMFPVYTGDLLHALSVEIDLSKWEEDE